MSATNVTGEYFEGQYSVVGFGLITPNRQRDLLRHLLAHINDDIAKQAGEWSDEVAPDILRRGDDDAISVRVSTNVEVFREKPSISDN